MVAPSLREPVLTPEIQPLAVPRITFVPVSGPSGVGEYYEALAIAAGVRQAWPQSQVHFVVNRAARYAHEVPHPCTLIESSPTRATRSVVAALMAQRPHVAVFISSGRVAQYRAARRLGARVVYMSQRPNSRWKGFRLRRMRHLDQHWISQSRIQGAALTWLERLKLRLAPVEMVFFDGLHEPLDEAAARARRASLGLEPGRYLVFCPGGGGNFGGVSAPEVFIEAARQVAARGPWKVLVVSGPNSTVDAADAERLATVRSLPNGELMALLRDARLAVINGGTLLVQTLMQGTPCVAAPIAGDQEQRIAPYAALGMAIGTRLQPGAMVAATMRLVDDETALAAMRAAIARMPLQNGVDVAVQALARLLPLQSGSPLVS
ncbi:MAG: hypothetical protein DIU71_00955 [Proteobacteria bacterium]|nr:MAG: hypothetical protein DIU71_00955 [Pseudomonadota bacterium]